MGSQSTPDNHEGIAQFPPKVDQEPEDRFVIGVATLLLKVHAELSLLAMRLEYQSSHCRHAIMAIPRLEQRSFASLGPRSTHQWLEHKSGFVDKNQASSAFFAPFLSSAIPLFAIGVPHVGHALLLVGSASDRNIPSGVACCRGGPGGTRS